MSVNGRGKKSCPQCGTINGARQRLCRCGYEFDIKIPESNCNWRELQKDDYIKVIQGTGPYYVDSSGNRTYLSSSGQYKVISVREDGLICMNVSADGGFCFIYMGEDTVSPLFSMIRRCKHSIVKIKTPRKFLSKE